MLQTQSIKAEILPRWNSWQNLPTDSVLGGMGTDAADVLVRNTAVGQITNRRCRCRIESRSDLKFEIEDGVSA